MPRSSNPAQSVGDGDGDGDGDGAHVADDLAGADDLVAITQPPRFSPSNLPEGPDRSTGNRRKGRGHGSTDGT
jgi:hypothetical protein